VILPGCELRSIQSEKEGKCHATKRIGGVSCSILLIVMAMIAPVASASTFELVAPSPTIKTYLFGTDYELFIAQTIPEVGYASAPGDVTATLQYVGLGKDSDFTDFHFASGNIALILRGDINFSDKVNNASAHNAMGVIIFDYWDFPPLQTVTLTNDTSIPSIFVTKAVGEQLQVYLGAGITTAHIDTRDVPEPSTMLLLGFGLLGIAGVRRDRT